MTINVNQLAVETRVNVDSAVPPPEPWGTILTRNLASATNVVEDYAADAPDDVLNNAVVLMVGYMIEAPFYSRMPQNAFVSSGARALLAPHHVPRYETVT